MKRQAGFFDCEDRLKKLLTTQDRMAKEGRYKASFSNTCNTLARFDVQNLCLKLKLESALMKVKRQYGSAHSVKTIRVDP